jgi:hypothetical protein
MVDMADGLEPVGTCAVVASMRSSRCVREPIGRHALSWREQVRWPCIGFPAVALYSAFSALVVTHIDRHRRGPAQTFDWALGRLATTLERYEQAEGHFVAAADIEERLGAPLFLARTHASWAHALIARGQPEDLERAQQVLEQAEEAATRLGAGGHRWRSGRVPRRPRDDERVAEADSALLVCAG